MGETKKSATTHSGQSGRSGTRTRHLGALRHRALMLAMEGRYGDAGRLLVAQLQLQPGEAARLGPEERKLVSVAATYLEKAGDTLGATSLFEALGNEERAALSRSRPSLLGPEDAVASGPTIMSLEPSPSSAVDPRAVAPGNRAEPTEAEHNRQRQPAPGDPSREPLRRARELIRGGHSSEAARLLSEAGLEYEAAVCRLKAGDFAGALRHLLRVPSTHERYPVAARTVARLLTRMGECRKEHVKFLRALFATPVENREQADLLTRLSALLETHGHLNEARAALRAVVVHDPEHHEASAALGRLHSTPTKDHIDSRVQRSQRPVEVAVSLAPGAETPDGIGVGTVFGDRFRLDDELGRGGMATVYSAHDMELDEQVALKVFSSELVTQDGLDQAVSRFRQELKLCRMLRHPNIIQVYDIGIHAGRRYFTMELLRGHSLEHYLGEPLDIEWSLDCLTQVAIGLHAAHEMGVVHRDVKPENLFVTKEGLVKVMDFGIAKSAYEPGKTLAGTFAGTPEYMAPEQISDFSAVGPAADQYALGCVAYELLTGRAPFEHVEMMPLLMMHIERAPVPLRHIHRTIPDGLERIVLKMMAKHPSDRYESLAHVTDALAGLR